jgi:hypothetical protein
VENIEEEFPGVVEEIEGLDNLASRLSVSQPPVYSTKDPPAFRAFTVRVNLNLYARHLTKKYAFLSVCFLSYFF